MKVKFSVLSFFLISLLFSCNSAKINVDNLNFSYGKFLGGQIGVVGYKYTLLIETPKQFKPDSIYVGGFNLPINNSYYSEELKGKSVIVGEIYKKSNLDIYNYFNSLPNKGEIIIFKDENQYASTQILFQSKTTRRN